MHCRKQTVVLCFITGCGLKQNSENIGLDRIKGKGETMSHIYDLIIIGSGPAGLAAAVYAQRAKLDTLVVEKAMVSGGQVLTTYEVDNYPGLPGIGGYDLGIKFREHADRLGSPVRGGRGSEYPGWRKRRNQGRGVPGKYL